MKERIKRGLRAAFGITAMGTLLVGGLLFPVFVLAFAVGGETGALLTLIAWKTMKLCIKIAALCVALGLATFYIEGRHFLTATTRGKETR